jgi:hypothetical protein
MRINIPKLTGRMCVASLLTAIIMLTSCSKDSSNGDNNSATDYSGKYQGSTSQKVTSSGGTVTQAYDMVIDISKGDNIQEIKILFGSWLTKATLNGNKFIIQETTFNGPIVTNGNGEFISGNKVNINYTQRIANSSTVNYSGTLTKF